VVPQQPRDDFGGGGSPFTVSTLSGEQAPRLAPVTAPTVTTTHNIPPSERSGWSVVTTTATPPPTNDLTGTTTAALDPWSSTTKPVDGGLGYTVERIWEPVYFDFDKFTIKPSETSKLVALAEYLKDQPRMHLLIEGHCDDLGTEEYNRTLGERRALSVREYLTARQIDGSRLRTLSYGQERPAVLGSTEDARAKNRRGELKVILPH